MVLVAVAQLFRGAERRRQKPEFGIGVGHNQVRSYGAIRL
jgi:hypothetical protein